MAPPKTVAERLAQHLAEIDALPASVLPATRIGLKHQARAVALLEQLVAKTQDAPPVTV